jgi:hypothetical protein
VLKQPVASAGEIEAQFSSISYAKGASILSMLNSFFAFAGLPTAFDDGVASYLAAHWFGNAESADLWGSFAAASSTPSLVP